MVGRTLKINTHQLNLITTKHVVILGAELLQQIRNRAINYSALVTMAPLVLRWSTVQNIFMAVQSLKMNCRS